jgi:hypothetical protein
MAIIVPRTDDTTRFASTGRSDGYQKASVLFPLFPERGQKNGAPREMHQRKME